MSRELSLFFLNLADAYTRYGAIWVTGEGASDARRIRTSQVAEDLRILSEAVSRHSEAPYNGDIVPIMSRGLLMASKCVAAQSAAFVNSDLRVTTVQYVDRAALCAELAAMSVAIVAEDGGRKDWTCAMSEDVLRLWGWITSALESHAERLAGLGLNSRRDAAMRLRESFLLEMNTWMGV